MRKRNIGMHTSAEQAKRNILAFLAWNKSGWENCYSKSSLGYAAYPEYNFKAPQGAAFSVAKIVRELEKDGFLASNLSGFHRGSYITRKGLEHLAGLPKIA